MAEPTQASLDKLLAVLDGHDTLTDAQDDLAASIIRAHAATLDRTPGRDRWPTSLYEMRLRFEAGDKPTISLNRMARERMSAGGCRVCSI